MKTLSTREYDLLDEILRTGDFGDGDPGAWDVFDLLEEQGLVGWYYGSISRELDEALGPEDPDYGEEIDPCVTSQGQLAMVCYRLVRS